MNDYADFPPVKLFKRSLLISPKTSLLYLDIYKLRTPGGNFVIQRKDVKKQFLISPTLFRNHLLALSRIDILSFEENPSSYVIKFFQ